MKRKILIAVICLLMGEGVIAQNEIMLSQRVILPQLTDPSYLAGDKNLSLLMNYKNAFEGIEGSPKLLAFNLRIPWVSQNLGFGIKGDFESIGYRKNNRLSAVADANVTLASGHSLALGLSLGAEFRRYDISGSTEYDGIGNIDISSYDKSFFVQSFGISYKGPRIKAGVGNFFANKSGTSDNGNLFVVFGYMSYKADLNQDFSLTPMVFVDYNNELGSSLDLSLMGHYKNYGGIGAVYRVNKMWAALLELNITDYVKLVYSCDINVGKHRDWQKVSHEIGLRFQFPMKK